MKILKQLAREYYLKRRYQKYLEWWLERERSGGGGVFDRQKMRLLYVYQLQFMRAAHIDLMGAETYKGVRAEWYFFICEARKR